MATKKIGDIDLYYEEHGQGDPLLLVMGLGGDSTAWMLQTPAFAEHFRTVVFDNRGVGRTSKPVGPYTIRGMADDAIGLMDALDIPRAHVVGVSMGGMIAQEMAINHPDRVRGLVLACTFAKPDDEVLAGRAASVASFGGQVTADGATQIDASALDPMMFFQHLLPRVFNPTFIQTELPRLMQLFGGALQWGFSMDAVLAQVDATMRHDTLERLSGIKAPTLVLTGDADLLIPPRCSDAIAARIPGARLTKLAGGSHGFNFEVPDDFNREVLTFLRGVPRPVQSFPSGRGAPLD